ncbi:Protein binding protein [Zea mays]|uniref:Protein binding protein n=3 Tax=Zea mays TaxID=4577 RepID=A0A1D6IA00_MAIZE|nr:Protein binding protein [Zea mays]
MDGSKGSVGGGDGTGPEKPSADSNPSLDPPQPTAAAVEATDDGAAAAAAEAARRPFTALSQEEADLALARVLQEQERAYMLLRMNGGGGEGSDYGSSDEGSYEYDEEGEEDYEEELEHRLRVHHHEHPSGDGEGEGGGEGEGAEGSDYDEEFEEDEEGEPEVDPAEFEDDEAYARALQDAEEREVAARLMALAGLSDWRTVEVEHEEDHANDPQELVALGEVVGTENRGLSADTLGSLPSVTYKLQHVQDGNTEQCVICRVELEEGESLIALPCKHLYHPECINQWLQINKVCPMCSAEVSTSGNKEP